MHILDAENLVADTYSNELKKIIVLQNVEGTDGIKLDNFAVDERFYPSHSIPMTHQCKL